MTGGATRWADAEYESLEAILRKRAGLVFQPVRRSTVESAAARVMARVGISSAEAFLPLIHQSGAVFDDLMAEVTIGETYFFREPQHFTLLRETIIPEFRRRADAGQTFRAWSAACSTGEEPYSIALALREEGVAGAVVGTDVSRARLSAARRGEYRRWSFRGVPDATIQRYFKRHDDTFVLAADVRRSVDFRYLNLASDCYPELSSGVWGMDVIFCRNVLIYFDRDTITHVARSLLASLGDDGWLLLGAADPPLDNLVQCEVVQTEAGLAYRHFRGMRFRPIRPPVQSVPVTRESIPLPSPVTQPLPSPAAPMPATATPAATASEAYAARNYDRTVAIVAPLVAAGGATANDFVLYVRALANMGRLDEAGRACAAALERYRNHSELHYLHAVLVAQAGQFAESARAAKRAIYLDRNMIVAHLALGSALAKSGDAAGALRAFVAAERLLSALPADDAVPGTDGEPAGRLLEMTRLQAALVTRGVAA